MKVFEDGSYICVPCVKNGNLMRRAVAIYLERTVCLEHLKCALEEEGETKFDPIRKEV